MRRAGGDDASAVEHDDAVAEREDLAVGVRDVEDRDVVRGVPGAQVVDDPRLRSRDRAPTAARRAAAPSGSVTSERASAARWRSPPEIAPGRRESTCCDAERLGDRADLLASAGARADRGGRTRCCRRSTCAERARAAETRSRPAAAGRERSGRSTRRRASGRRSRSIRRPGRISPATDRSSVLLPDPDAPNTIVMPGGASIVTSSVNVGRQSFVRTETATRLTTLSNLLGAARPTTACG